MALACVSRGTTPTRLSSSKTLLCFAFPLFVAVRLLWTVVCLCFILNLLNLLIILGSALVFSLFRPPKAETDKPGLVSFPQPHLRGTLHHHPQHQDKPAIEHNPV
ncbi:hypothetical protein BDV18DRAFT_94962 [Aspergillus unguis]